MKIRLAMFLILPIAGLNVFADVRLFGSIRDKPGTYLAGVKVQLMGNPGLSTTSDSLGRFTILSSTTGLREKSNLASRIRWQEGSLETDLLAPATVGVDAFDARGRTVWSLSPQVLPAGLQHISIPRKPAGSVAWLQARVDGKTQVLPCLGHLSSGMNVASPTVLGSDPTTQGALREAGLGGGDTLVFSKAGYPQLKLPLGNPQSSDSIRAVFDRSPLAPLAAGKQMTIQFNNNTRGKFADNQIYILALGFDPSGKRVALNAVGDLVPVYPGQTAAQYSLRLSDLPNGMQVPTTMVSVRLYVCYGSSLDFAFNVDALGRTGVPYPNVENPSDANIDKDFDFVEFNVDGNMAYCNTTQVDMFSIPITMEMFSSKNGIDKFEGEVGITESRSQIFGAWNATATGDFQKLITPHRILAPVHGPFSINGGSNQHYWDSYIDAVWNQYKAGKGALTIEYQGALYSGTVDPNTQVMTFTRPGDATLYPVSKPTSWEVWGGSGAFATGNNTQLQMEAKMCAAFHRHVLETSSDLTTPTSYYQKPGGDLYSGFWHQHSIAGKAYGFCYDDVNDQSTTLIVGSPRAMILSLGW